jgi:hypothetical protein
MAGYRGVRNLPAGAAASRKFPGPGIGPGAHGPWRFRPMAGGLPCAMAAARCGIGVSMRREVVRLSQEGNWNRRAFPTTAALAGHSIANNLLLHARSTAGGGGHPGEGIGLGPEANLAKCFVVRHIPPRSLDGRVHSFLAAFRTPSPWGEGGVRGHGQASFDAPSR